MGGKDPLEPILERIAADGHATREGDEAMLDAVVRRVTAEVDEGARRDAAMIDLAVTRTMESRRIGPRRPARGRRVALLALATLAGGVTAAAAASLDWSVYFGEAEVLEGEPAPSTRAMGPRPAPADAPAVAPTPDEVVVDEVVVDEVVVDEVAVERTERADPTEQDAEDGAAIERDRLAAARRARLRAARAERSKRDVPAPAPPEMVREEDPPDTPASLLAAANAARDAGRLDEAVARYRALQERFAGSRAARVSHLSMARILMARGRHAAALAGYEAYLGAGPPDALTETAMAGRARALESLGRRAAARQAWSALLHRFPDSPFAARARRALGSEP